MRSETAHGRLCTVAYLGQVVERRKVVDDLSLGDVGRQASDIDGEGGRGGRLVIDPWFMSVWVSVWVFVLVVSVHFLVAGLV